jgi:hypothetical protein
MIPLGPILGVAGIAAATILVPMAVRGYNGMITEREGLRIQIALEQQKDEYQELMRQNADREEKDDTEQRKVWDAERTALEEQNSELLDNAEDRIRADASAFDSDLYRTISRIMCRAEVIGDQNARRSCNVRTEQADFTGGGPILSITPKRIEDWRIKCEETGERLFCDYAIPAITADGMKDIVDWMTAADSAMLVYDSNHDIFVRQIDYMKNLPKPTITKE